MNLAIVIGIVVGSVVSAILGLRSAIKKHDEKMDARIAQINADHEAYMRRFRAAPKR